MLIEIEHILLGLLRWFYSEVPAAYGIVTIGAIGTILVCMQFFNRGKSVWHGTVGVFFLIATYYHIEEIRRLYVIQRLDSLMGNLEPSNILLLPVPVLEPFFTTFIGRLEERHIYHEVFALAFTTYLVLAFYTCYKEYKKTGQIFTGIGLKGLFKPKQQRPKRSVSNELGSGDLATTEQIAEWIKPSKKYDTFLNVTDLRGSEGVAFKNARLAIPAEKRNRHILAIAKTGSGKTTKLILPVLYSDCLCPDRSTIVIDSKPEMWRKLAAMTRKYNPQKNIMLFNPLDTVRSMSWNILSKIEDETDCKLIANTIILATDVPSAKSDSPFFRQNALSILNAIMVGLLHDKNDVLSMPRIHELVQSGMKPLCEWLEAHPHALRNTRTFVELARSGSQNADTIMSELGMRLSAWDLPAVRATTEKSELDIEKLISEPTLFIVELRESELEMLRPMANVIVIELLRFLTKRAERCQGSRLPRPVGLVIDEFASSLGRLPDIHVKLNTLRSRNVSIVAAIQSIAQVKANYGDDADSVLAGFTSKIFMPQLDIQDSEWASKETGQMTVRFLTASKGTNKKLIEWFASKNDGTQEQVQQRAVLTPDEIGRPVDGISTFFLPDTPVFQGHLVAFFKNPEMLKRITESDNDLDELRVRDHPLEIDEKLPTAAVASSNGSSTSVGAPGYMGGPPPGITNTTGWTEEQVVQKLEEVKKTLDWDNTTGSARKWWEAFEAENKVRTPLVLRLAEELALRKATITEFFLAYVYSNTDNIQANLSYLDYTRLKKEEEKKKREAAAQASGTPISEYEDLPGSDLEAIL